MDKKNQKRKIGIIGGGPAGLFLYKRLIESGRTDMEVTIFERKDQLGAGMPYSAEGANDEHVTNVSDNEIPEIVTPIRDWIQKAPFELLKRFDMKPEAFNEYKVVPRLLFGEYLSAQFAMLLELAQKKGIPTTVLPNTTVVDMEDERGHQQVKVTTAEAGYHRFDAVVISTGHHWKQQHEGTIPNYFDSPYPPAKLALKADYPVAIRGASLTAIDAVRTLARKNGSFERDAEGNTIFKLADDSPNFRIALHALGGLLPAIRFHLDDSHLSQEFVLSEAEVAALMAANNGFVPLDYLFETAFMEPLQHHSPEFYERVKGMNLEAFVAHMMSLRESLDPILLFKAEYAEAAKSIRQHQSVYWKEALAMLSFAMNYPAKHFSAEDMLRLRQTLMPLISIVIAFVPQSSCRELLALYDAGVLSLVPVDRDSQVEPKASGGAVYHYRDEMGKEVAIPYKLFVDCIGQPPLQLPDFPFRSLLEAGSISPARLRFASAVIGAKAVADGNAQVEQDADGSYYLKVPGITINDYFQVLDQWGAYSDRIYIMAVPFIAGYNPDYSGLDFCEAASERIVEKLLEEG